MVQPHGAEIVANGLQRIVERFGDSAEIGRAGRGRGPCVDQRRDADERQSRRRARDSAPGDQLARQVAAARVGVGNQVHAGLMQVLAESFVIAEHEGLVLLDRAAQRDAELVALKARNGIRVEEVAGVEVVVAQEFVERSVQLIGSGLGDDQNLAAGTLAVLGAVGIGEQVEFPHRVHAQQLLAGAAGLHVVFRRARELHAIQQEQILLRPVPGNRRNYCRRSNSKRRCRRFSPR